VPAGQAAALLGIGQEVPAVLFGDLDVDVVVVHGVRSFVCPQRAP
jgi:hypothetical protein